MYAADIAAEAERWIEYLTPRIKEKGVELVHVELYIRLDDEKDCLYYAINRKDQTLFWLEDFETDSLGLPEVVSPSHLRTQLEAQYWAHIDRFPAHFGGLPEAALSKVLDVFVHTRIDQITSLTSAFTYGPVDTEAFRVVLKDCQGRTREPEVVSTVARAWYLVLYNRFHNQYGEETPRLDSTMSILSDQEDEREGYTKRLMSFLTFGKSERYRTKLNSLFVDKYVYSHRVHSFLENALKEWREQYTLDFLMLFLHGAFFVPVASQTVAALSAACFSASLLTSLALIQQHDDRIDHRNSSIAIDWISDRASEVYKFQRLAFAFALPTAFFNWGLLFFFGHWLYIGLSHLSMNVAVTFAGVLILACITFISATAPGVLPVVSPHRLVKLFRWKRDPDANQSMV